MKQLSARSRPLGTTPSEAGAPRSGGGAPSIEFDIRAALRAALEPLSPAGIASDEALTDADTGRDGTPADPVPPEPLPAQPSGPVASPPELSGGASPETSTRPSSETATKPSPETSGRARPVAVTSRPGPAAASSDVPGPELSSALDAVSRAGDLVRAAHARALDAEERSVLFADHAAEQIAAAEQRARDAEAGARALEERMRSVADLCRTQVQQAERRIEEVTASARSLEEGCNQKLATARRAVDEALRRASDAERDAQKARTDLAYLDRIIREQFGILEP